MTSHRQCFASVCLLGVISTLAAAQESRPAAFATVRDAVLESERAFDHIRIRAQILVEQWNATGKSWDYQGEASATSWFADKPGGKVRQDVDKQITPWIGGTAERSEDRYVVTFNGRVGMILRTHTGPAGHAFQVDRAAITPGRPNNVAMWGARFSGWKYSTLGFFDHLALRFSEFLDRQARNLQVDASDPTRVRVWLPPTGASTTEVSWVLDVRRGAALVAYELTLRGRRAESLTVSDLAEAAPGLFFPSRAEWINYDTDGTAKERETFIASEVDATGAPLPDEHFQIQFPQGTVVEDQVADVDFRIGPAPAQLAVALTSESAALRAAMAEGAVTRSPGPAASGATADRGLPVRLALVALGIALVATAGFTAFIRRRRLQLATAAAVLVAATGAGAQERSLAVAEIGAQRVYNCGVNTCALVLQSLGKEQDLEDIARGLGCGEHWENAAAMAAMQDLLQARGLSVEGFKDAKVGDVLAGLDGQHLQVIHCRATGRAEGHYLVAGALRNDEVFVANPGAGARWTPVAQFTERMQRRMTGYVLRVANDAKDRRTPYTLDEGTITLDLGEVGAIEGLVTADLPVVNPRSTAVEIVHAQASCTCFQKAEFVTGRDRLAPGGLDTLRLTFNKSKLTVGPNTQQVLIGLKTPAERKVLLKVMAHVTKDAVGHKVACVPEKLDLGVVRDPALLAKPQLVSLILPAGVTVLGVRTSTTDLAAVRNGTSHDAGSASRAPTRTETFEVRVRMPASGTLKGEVTFDLSDASMRSLSVPVLAELRGR